MDSLIAQRILYKSKGSNPTAAQIEELLKVVGAKVESSKISAMVSALEGKAPEELIQQGMGKISVAAAPAASQAAAPAAAAAPPKEEPEEEESSSGMDLFG